MAPRNRYRFPLLFACLFALITAAPPARAFAPADHVASLSLAASDPGLAPWQRAYYQRQLSALLAGALPAGEGPQPAVGASPPPTPVWSRTAETPRRQGQSMVLDTLSGRLYVFGGTDGSTVTNTLFALDPDGARTWIRLSPAGDAPPARMAHAAVFDGANRRMLVYGGTDQYGSYLGDFWALNLDGPPVWTPLDVAGGPLSGRANCFAVVDTLNDRMLLYGGGNGGFSPLTDLWSFSLAGTPAWSAIVPTVGVTPGFTALSAMMDERNHRFVLAGTLASSYTAYVTLEFLSINTQPPAWAGWTTPYSGQPYDYYPFSFVMDNTNSRLVALPSDYSPQECTLTITGASAWADYPCTGAVPVYRYGRAAVVDDKHRRVFVQGGSYAGYQTGRTFCDLSSLDLVGYAAWTAVAGEPAARTGHSLAFDPARGAVHMFGGVADSTGSGYNSTYSNQLWSLASGAEAPSWAPEPQTGAPILPRAGAALVVDPVRDQLVLFGGTNGSATTNEVWLRPLTGGTAWSAPPLVGTLPRQRHGPAAVFDPIGDRVLMFGGLDDGDNGLSYLGDLWALSLGGTPHWAHLLPAGVAPGPRRDAFLTFDTVHQCAYLVGGSDAGYGYGTSSIRSGETWKLSFAPALRWDKLSSGLGANPYYGNEEINGAAFYDTDQGALVRVVSTPYNVPNAAVSKLVPGADTSWTTVSAAGIGPPSSVYGIGVFDRLVRRMIWFGGVNTNELGTWALSLGVAPLAVPPAGAVVPRAMSVFPNPAHDRVGVRFALAQAGKVQLELMDLSGRRVRGPLVASCPAGPFELALGDVGSLPAGVYFARLSGALAQRARVAIVH